MVAKGKMRHLMVYKARIYVPDCNEDKMEKICTALDELLMDFEIRCFIEDELEKKPEFEGSEVTVDWE